MVDLPRGTSDAIVTSTGPRSSVSAADVASPYNQAAEIATKASNQLMDVAKEGAKNQAAEDLQQQKVTRNADGSVNVENPVKAPLIFGEAGKVYTDAARVGTLAQQSNALSRDFADLHTKFPTDPAGFKKAAEAHLAKTGQTVDGVLGQAIRAQGEQLLTQHYNAITNTAATTDVQRQAASIIAGISSARNDALVLARQGLSSDDPAIQNAYARFHDLTTRRAANPAFAYPPEQAKLDADAFDSEVQVSRVLYGIDRTYKDQGPGGGYNGAMVAAKDILTNPAYKLSQQQREAYYHKAVGDIRANEAIRRQDVSEARAAFTDLSAASAGGVRIESDRVESLAKQFRDAGDPGGSARVYASFARKPLNDDFGRQPIPEMNKQLQAIHGANRAAAAFQFFTGKGYTPEQAAGIVGNLVHESDLDPTASHDRGTGLGVAGHRLKRLEGLKKFAADRGKPVDDTTTQLEFIDHELNTTERATLAKLKAAKTPEEAGAAFINFERPQGWTPENPAAGHGYQSRLSLSRQIFDRNPADQSMGPAGSLWFEVNRQRSLDTAATARWQTIMKDYGTTTARPSLQTVNEVVQAARLSGNSELLETIATDSQRMDLARDGARLPLPSQQDFITRLKAAGETGELSPGNAALKNDLEQRRNAIVTGLEKNPVATTVTNFPEKFKTPGPLDFSSQGALAGSIAERVVIAQFAAKNWETPPLAPLDQEDVRQLQAAMQTPGAPQVIGALVSALKPDELKLALNQRTELRDSLTGLMLSKDPARMNTAMGAVDLLWSQNAAEAEVMFGKEAITRLHAWLGLKDSFDAQELAQRLNMSDDPRIAKGREELRTQAETEAGKLSPSDVAYKLGGGWFSNLIGQTPGIPLDGVAGYSLVSDYRATYSALRAYGVDADKASDLAVKRLQSTWGPSEAAGNLLMRNPPESFLPAIGGSKEWVGQQLRAWVAKEVGPEFVAGPRSLEMGMAGVTPERKWRIAGLVSDRRTEVEITSGKSPSYGVAIMKNGAMEFLQKRMVFDPSDVINSWVAELQGREDALNTIRASQFSLGNAMP